MTKVCKRCSVAKNLDLFHKDRKSLDQLNTICKSCKSLDDKKYRETHQIELKAKKREYYLKVEKHKRKLRTLDKLKRLSLSNKIYRENNIERIKYNYKIWRLSNKATVNARNMRRYAAKLNQCPPWVNKEHLERIKQFYANCPKGYHVDHIIPLQGKEIRGLHVIWNLQYLPAIENIRKSNKVS
jgi:hypothetical protein